jgi:hypothetical protein
VTYDFIATVKEARRIWLEDNAKNDGTDEVTPFDRFLYGQPQAEPVGEWVMVPREPTPKMLSAVSEAYGGCQHCGPAVLSDADLCTLWGVLIATAPAPQVSAEDVAHMNRVMQRAYFYPEDVEAWQRIEADMLRLLGVSNG